ncbi:MAG: hypothetical protein ACP5NC_05190 [Nitrososphaeria archaeon]
MTKALGSALGLPTLPFSFTGAGSAAFEIIGKISISSIVLNLLYFFQSLGVDLFPWFLPKSINLRLRRMSYLLKKREK